jgi:single-stranded DNA-binding protein
MSLNKVLQVFVEGSLRTRKWESNGVNGRHTEIAATRVQFLRARPTDAKV